MQDAYAKMISITTLAHAMHVNLGQILLPQAKDLLIMVSEMQAVNDEVEFVID